MDIPFLLLKPEAEEHDENLDPEYEIPDEALLETIEADTSQRWG